MIQSVPLGSWVLINSKNYDNLVYGSAVVLFLRNESLDDCTMFIVKLVGLNEGELQRVVNDYSRNFRERKLERISDRVLFGSK